MKCNGCNGTSVIESSDKAECLICNGLGLVITRVTNMLALQEGMRVTNILGIKSVGTVVRIYELNSCLATEIMFDDGETYNGWQNPDLLFSVWEG